MSNSRWRARAAPIIRRVLAETKGKDEKAIRKALNEAYPFGQREHHPYKIWRDEIRSQRGLKHRARAEKAAKQAEALRAAQPDLFGPEET